MKVAVVRVHKAEVSVEEKVISAIEKGIVAFVGFNKNDGDSLLAKAAEKIVNLRIFEDEQGKMNHSAGSRNYQILCVPNFTLCANTKKGCRPSFEEAMPPAEAKKLFEDFISVLRSKYIKVKAGVFGARMEINLKADGPVNIILEMY